MSRRRKAEEARVKRSAKRANVGGKEAMSRRIKYILIIVSVALSLTGTMLWGVLSKKDDLDRTTRIEIEGETQKTLKAEITDFYPGKEASYKIELTGSRAQDFTVTLNFRDDDGGELKEYIIVTIETNVEGDSSEKSLKELLNGESLELGKGATEIEIRYRMPETVGNEAQGTSVEFYIDVRASNG